MNKKVLVIDDDEVFLKELGETLELSGYDIVSIGEPALAVNTAQKIKPNAILLDLKMPHKSGFQVAQELRQYADTQGIPIIAMSAFFRDSYGPLMEICGIRKCLRKPFNPLDVINAIENALLSGK